MRGDVGGAERCSGEGNPLLSRGESGHYYRGIRYGGRRELSFIRAKDAVVEAVAMEREWRTERARGRLG